MWNFKKIVFTVLALLTIAPLLLMLISGIFNSEFTLEQLRWGDCNIVYGPNNYISVTFNENSILHLLLGAFIRSGTTFRDGSVLHALFTGLYRINEALGWNVGIMPVVLISVYYLIYYVFLYFVNMLIDLITLIPRLCERLFKL